MGVPTEPTAVRPQNMAAYGVPETNDGLLSWSWARTRLTSSRNYWLVTASKAGRPHSMPVWGTWTADDVFFVSCDGQARKARNMRENPAVVVTVDDTVEVVSVEGVATEIDVTDTPQLKGYLGPLVDKYEEFPSVDQVLEFFSSNAAFVVRPERAFAIIERPDEFGPSATKWVW